MAAGRVKFLHVISVWFLVLSYAFEFGKHNKIHIGTGKMPFTGNNFTPWIKGSILCRIRLTISLVGNYSKSRVTIATAQLLLR